MVNRKTIILIFYLLTLNNAVFPITSQGIELDGGLIGDSLSIVDSTKIDTNIICKLNQRTKSINETHSDSIKTIMVITLQSKPIIRSFEYSTFNVDMGCNLGFVSLNSKSSFYLDPDNLGRTTITNSLNPFFEAFVVIYSKSHYINYCAGITKYSTFTNYYFQTIGLFSTNNNINLQFNFLEIPIYFRIDPWFWSNKRARFYFDAGVSFVALLSAKMTGTSSAWGESTTETVDISKDLRPFFIMPRIGIGFKMHSKSMELSLGINKSSSIFSIVKDNLSPKSILNQTTADSNSPNYTYKYWQFVCSLSHCFSFKVKKNIAFQQVPSNNM